MDDKRLKNIGLKKDVWLQLSALAKEREITLSEAVDYLLKLSNEHGNQPSEPDAVGRQERD